ncbi:Hypothetical predicted protein [Cloeon dipterum]|uniref:FYVE-type domain-containing protein n=1 Tax=Cloeon dipterum TaxID=197152 RepID=A0A8S1CMB0_9INSE|nr:Hypothetical predicted protein [Cloeon dipterum]
MENKCIKRLIRSKSGLRIVTTDDTNKSPFLLGEPHWVPDKDSVCCTDCKKKFDFLTRRHHCRRCGRIYCKNCCDFRLELPRMCFVDPVRHCESCADISRKENEFFDKELKMLTGGALFQLIKLPESNEKRSEFICRLSQDHRYLNFDGSVEEEFEPVQLASIMELNLLRSPDVPPGMFVTYMNNEGTVKEMTLLAPPDCNKNHTISWLSAMQNGFKMATDSRNIS